MSRPTSFLRYSGLILLSAALCTSAQTETKPLAPAKIEILTPPPTLDGKPQTPTPRLTPWAKEMVKLAQSGIDEGVLLAYIDNAGVFGLGADQLIYLKEQGLSSQLLAAMLQHDREVIAGERALTITSEPKWDPLVFSREEPVKTPPSTPTAPALPQTVTEVKSPQTAKEVQAPAPNKSEWRTVSPLPEKKPLYPTRKPYAVELLPPIIVVTAPESTPDAVIIAGFAAPSSR